MNQTENYQLSLWDPEDRIQRTDFNSDNANIEAALTGLSTTVAAHTAAIAQMGSCQFHTASYTGNGANGTTISQTFPKKPMAVIVVSSNGGTMVMIRGSNRATHFASASYSYLNTVTWGDTSVAWRSSQSAGGEPQMNASGVTYYVLALLDASAA